jgi:beta-phosphoglucomutase-like phosphatase (HAD superfamily)
MLGAAEIVLKKEPAVLQTALDKVLSECEHLMLGFHGPVCDMSVCPTGDVISSLHRLLASHGVQPPGLASASTGLYDILRFILTACPGLAGPAEAQVAAHEIRAAATARPAVGVRTLLHGPAQVTIIGNACRPAIDTYLGRLYRRERGQIRLIIARQGADPAILEPTPIPVLQAAQLLGIPPPQCAVVASTPAEIHSAREAGAHAIGYAWEPATSQRLTAAGAEAVTVGITALAGSAYRTALRRRTARRRTGPTW